MIESVKVENFQGIERLEVKGLRRVNLITGKNDCGKTSLLEAISMSLSGSIAFPQLAREFVENVVDFDNYWRPLFRGGDAERGFTTEMLNDPCFDPLRRFLLAL